MLELFVYTIKLEGNDMAALSLLPPHVAQAHGLPTQAVLGEVDHRQPDMTVDGFTPNEDFLTFLHKLIQENAPALDSVQKQAVKVQNGPVYVMDYRSINQGMKPPFEDVLGWFGVRNGEILTDTYNPSPNYKLITNNGVLQLEQTLEDQLQDAIDALVYGNEIA